MPEPKDAALRNYPRAAGRPPNGALLGLLDIAELAGVQRKTVWIWLAAKGLPEADGPDIDHRPTWTRETVLLWLLARGSLPVAHLRDAEALLKTANGPKRFRALRERFGVV